jgi:ABC-type polysaccharide transport system permease subunit
MMLKASIDSPLDWRGVGSDGVMMAKAHSYASAERGQTISSSEAADVDGASTWFQVLHITAPLLRPVMIPAITLGIVWTFNNINGVWLVSNMGEPADSTTSSFLRLQGGL